MQREIISGDSHCFIYNLEPVSIREAGVISSLVEGVVLVSGSTPDPSDQVRRNE